MSFIPGGDRKNGDRNLGLGCAFVGGNSSGMEKRNVCHGFFYLTGQNYISVRNRPVYAENIILPIKSVCNSKRYFWHIFYIVIVDSQVAAVIFKSVIFV